MSPLARQRSEEALPKREICVTGLCRDLKASASLPSSGAPYTRTLSPSHTHTLDGSRSRPAPRTSARSSRKTNMAGCRGCFFFLFFTLVTGPSRSLSLKLRDTRVYDPPIRARLGPLVTSKHLSKCWPHPIMELQGCLAHKKTPALQGPL